MRSRGEGAVGVVVEWRIRELGPEAARVVERLLREGAGGRWGPGAVASALTTAGAWSVGALDDEGRIAGLVLARQILDLLEIDQVVVTRDRRRRGAARAMLTDLLARAGRSGVREVRLELAAANAPALALYAGLGFMVVGRRARYYPDGEDALLLSRALSEEATPSARVERTAEEGLAAASPGIEPAGPIRGHARVVANEVEGSGRRLRLEVDGWPGARPGQFVMIGAGAESAAMRRDPLLPRPMAVYRDRTPGAPGGPAGPGPGWIEILFRVVGRGTTLLAETAVGQSLSLVGPLGRSFPVESGPVPALLIGGGTGIASLYELAAALVRVGRPVHLALGARSGPDLIGRPDFAAIEGLDLVCTTEDGSLGRRGLVTQPLAEWLDAFGARATVFACGPTPMMRACAELAEARGAACWVSLENPMACGFGVCLGCAAPRRSGGFALVCRAGPVFESREIDWAGLP